LNARKPVDVLGLPLGMAVLHQPPLHRGGLMIRMAVTAALTLSLGLAHSQERPKITEIGEIKTLSGAMLVLVNEKAGKRDAYIYLRDRHNIRTQALGLEPAELRKLKQLIDEALAEIESGAAPASQRETARAAAAAELAAMSETASQAGQACRTGETVDIACVSAVGKCRAAAATAAQFRECWAASGTARK
jgi:hypothetical protein